MVGSEDEAVVVVGGSIQPEIVSRARELLVIGNLTLEKYFATKLNH